MREREIEKYLVDRVKGMGGMALKFVSPGCTGVPDRLVILPGASFLCLTAENLRLEPSRSRAAAPLENFFKFF